MINGIENSSNKDRIAIVVVGYNRQKSLSRLLESVSNAQYEVQDVPLVISIDASGNQELYDFVNEYKWNHGKKYVNIQSERLGLKNHIFQCMSLSRYFKGVIILEDDIFVSPYFYHYCISSLEKYGDDSFVSGIALYTNEYDGFHNIPIQRYHNGFDVFASQGVCSWGEMINERMWTRFSEWFDNFDGDFSRFDMDDRIKSWERAWSKYMYAFMLDTNTYFIFPFEPLSTNFNDAGGEHGGNNNLVQINMLQGKRYYQFGDFSQLVRYDIYGYNTMIASWLKINENDLIIDLWGDRRSINTRYILTQLELPYKVISSYRLSMRPWELNIKYGLKGNDIFLYDTGGNDMKKMPNPHLSYSFKLYFFHRFVPSLKFDFFAQYYWVRIKRKLSIFFKIK